MALAGRKPKPAALRLLEGNREHRPIKEPVKLSAKLPKTPGWLKGPALTMWKECIKEMSATPGWLTSVDKGVLTAYCICWACIVRCGGYIENRRGGEAKYLEWCQKNKHQPRHALELRQARKDIRPLAAELGFSPTSRGRIEPAGKAEEGEEDLD